MPTFGPIDLTEEEDAELRHIAAHPKGEGGRGKAVPRIGGGESWLHTPQPLNWPVDHSPEAERARDEALERLAGNHDLDRKPNPRYKRKGN